MSKDIDGLVQTSLNLGIMSTTKIAMTREIKLCFSVRSSMGSEKQEPLDRIECLVKAFDGEINISGEYPAWEYKKDSRLRDIMYETYTDLFGENPTVEAVHAGLECGIIYHALKPVDIVSFGPTVKGAHTPKETLSISSTERTYDLLVALLRELK
jgi:dipeptidase D